jgi:hypothetical protein
MTITIDIQKKKICLAMSGTAAPAQVDYNNN